MDILVLSAGYCKKKKVMLPGLVKETSDITMTK